MARGKDIDIDMQGLPEHVAIVMDGNGRWAKKFFLGRAAGHRAGAQALRKLAEKMNENGFKLLTVYAFSTENWTRSDEEVTSLMNLMREYIQQYIDDKDKNNMRINVIGDVTPLDDDLKQKIAYLKEQTRNYKGMCINIALNYGGRDEIVRTARKISADVKNGNVLIDDINEKLFQTYLDTAEFPDPDLFIRTSGETRVSNFLLWQISYSELYFTDKLWPDFSYSDLMEAVEKYRRSERRFGGRK